MTLFRSIERFHMKILKYTTKFEEIRKTKILEREVI